MAGGVFQWALPIYPALSGKIAAYLWSTHFYESGQVSLCACFFPLPWEVLLFHRNSAFAWGFAVVVVVSDVK